jgi:hypothetical protein
VAAFAEGQKFRYKFDDLVGTREQRIVIQRIRESSLRARASVIVSMRMRVPGGYAWILQTNCSHSR